MGESNGKTDLLTRSEPVHSHKCPVCQADSGRRIIQLDKFPYFTNPVSRSDKEILLHQYPKDRLWGPLRVQACDRCCHCYIETLPDPEMMCFLYSRFYHYPSPLSGDFIPERDDRFIEIFTRHLMPVCRDRRLSSVLDVGCYDGYVLYRLQSLEFSVTGCDPSQGADIGRRKGLHIHKRFFDPAPFLEAGQKFDIVLCRHLIEHTAAPGRWIQDLSRVLNPEGMLVLETPNTQYYLEKGLLEVFSLQHLQGFSPNSLHHLLCEEGFHGQRMYQTPANLIGATGFQEYAEPNTGKGGGICPDALSRFQSTIARNKAVIGRIVIDYVKRGKTVSLWGAGGFGMAAFYLYGIPEENIACIIDSDPQKREMEYLDMSIPVVSPDDGLAQISELIIITSMYSHSISERIRKMRLPCDVLSIFPEVKLQTRESASCVLAESE